MTQFLKQGNPNNIGRQIKYILGQLKKTSNNGNAPINEVKLTLTADQINNIGTTPIELVPSPGPGKYLKMVEIDFWLNFNSVSFDSNFLILEAVGADSIQCQTNFSFIGSNSNITNSLVISNTGTTQVAENSPLIIRGTDSVAVGNSTIDIYLTYKVTER